MALDTGTLLFASASGRGAYLLIFIVSGLRRRSEQYFLHWATSIGLSMVGLLLTSGGQTYPFLSPLQGTLIYSIYGCSIGLCWTGIRSFLDRTFFWRSFAVQSLLPGLLYGLVGSLTSDPAQAIAAMFAGLVVIIGRAAGELLIAASQERLPSQFLAAAALSIYFLMFLVSMVLFLISPDAVSNPADAYFSLIVDQSCSILIYIGFLAMAGERAAARLERLAATDALTGLSNRRGVLMLVERMLPVFVLNRQPVSVLLADIDRFKAINDTYGHEAGDVVLAEFARRCRTVLKRRSDLVARWGGEEFVAVLPNTPLEQGAELAEQLRVTTEAEAFLIGEVSASVTVSIGVACLNDARMSFEDAIRQADHALYAAKETGRNRICLSPPDVSPTSSPDVSHRAEAKAIGSAAGNSPVDGKKGEDT